MYGAIQNLLWAISGDYWEELRAMLCIVCAALCGIGIFIVFYITHRKISVSRGFAFTLIMLAPVTAMVAVIISYDLVIAVGMLGALSIIRFRHSMKESKNLVFVFWSVTAGLLCGLSFIEIAMAGCVITAALAVAVHFYTESGNYGTLSIKTNSEAGEIEKILDEHSVKYQVKYRGAQKDSDINENTDILYELRYKKAKKDTIDSDVCKKIICLEGVVSVRFIEM